MFSADDKQEVAKTRYSELVLVAARDVPDLCNEIRRLAGFLGQAPGVPLRDVAYTCASAYKALEEKNAVLALVVSSVPELQARLAVALPRIEGGAERVRDKSGAYFFRKHALGPGTEGRPAFMFPGATSFYPDMLRDLVIGFPECRAAFDELEEALAGSGRFSPSSFIFPPAPYYRRDADVFSAGAYAQAMVSTYSANAALYRMFSLLGVKPDGVMGFAGGDLNALAVAGYLGGFNRPDRLKFLKEMYGVVDSAVAHAGLPKCLMAAILSPHPEETDAILATFPADKVTTFFEATPRQRMIAVASDAVQAVQHALAAAGVKGMRLDVDRPFNTPWCEKIIPMFRKFAGHWACARAQTPVWCCATAAPLPEKGRQARDVCAELWARPVRLGETIRNMYDAGLRVFLEVGPRGVIANAADDILRGIPHAAVRSNAMHRSGLLQFQHAVGCLAALGAPIDPDILFTHHRCRMLDFSSALQFEIRADSEMVLQREFPSLRLLTPEASAASTMSAPRRIDKVRGRQEAAAARARRRRQLDFGATMPMISDMDVVSEQPGESVEIRTTLSFANAPFLADAALGTSQISYANPELRGLALLPLAAGAEIMAELAQRIVPGRSVVALEDLLRRRTVAFRDNGELAILVRAERIASDDPGLAAVHVQLRDDSPDSAWTWPAMETTVRLAAMPEPARAAPEPLRSPRSVHWTGSDIYPARLASGGLLRLVRKADLWSDGGLDYEIETPATAGAVAHTRFPVWVVNPLLLQAVVDGYSLWRSHERFPGAFSFAFRLRRLSLHALSLPEGQRLRGYLRLAGVTPNSHICDIQVSDGNGNLVMDLRGYEELAEHVPDEYRTLVLRPPLAYLTEELPVEDLGAPATPIASALVTGINYPLFTRNENIWLKTVSRLVLGKNERRSFDVMSGSVRRRTEWLFGRIAAKEAVRRFLQRHCQARWTDADVEIWADDSGKPHALGKWDDDEKHELDIAIAHTAQFVIAVVAAHARVGVDVEEVDRDLSDEFTQGVFSHEELALAADSTNPHAAVIRFWCAKEAVSKALGTGIRYSPKELVVDAFRPETGEMELLLTGAWEENFKMLRGRPIRTSSTTMRGHVVAACFIPASIFE